MVVRRLSLSAKPPRYVPLPTKDRHEEPSYYASSSPGSHCSSNDTLPSVYPPSPTPSGWGHSMTSLVARFGHQLRHLLFSLLERCAIDKGLSQFCLRRLAIALAFAAASGLSLVLLSLLVDLSPLGPLPWWLGRTHPLDREDSFRWDPELAASHSQRPIPFLLNRFGYPAQPAPKLEPVPSILHLVPPGKGRFSYLQWFSISSGVRNIKPQRTMAHMIAGTVPEPGENFWWDEVTRLAGFEVHEVEDPKEVFGNPVVDVSHKSDVIRLKALLEWGGVYIDTDVVVLRPFDELMTGAEEIVLGVEKADGTFQTPTKINGLCNAVIVTKKDAAFLKAWWQKYRTFNGHSFREGNTWNYHSVILPWAMAKNASASGTPVTVLDHKSFFTPLWDDPALKWVHGTLQAPAATSELAAKIKQARPSTPRKGQGAASEPDETAHLKPPSSRFRLTVADLETPLSTDFAQDELTNIETLQHGELAPNLPGFRLEATGQFAYHMWHHLLDERITFATDGLLKSARDLTPEDALSRDSSFNRVARKYLTPALMERYRAWKERQARTDRTSRRKSK